MLLAVNYVRTDITNYHFHYSHHLVDKDYTKKFSVKVSSEFNDTEHRILIANGILEFIRQNYQDTPECPFTNIKNLYNKNGITYNDAVIRRTSFYNNHSKVMDKILRPVAISPAKDYYSATFGSYMTYGSASTTSTINVNVTYPTQFIYDLRIQ